MSRYVVICYPNYNPLNLEEVFEPSEEQQLSGYKIFESDDKEAALSVAKDRCHADFLVLEKEHPPERCFWVLGLDTERKGDYNEMWTIYYANNFDEVDFETDDDREERARWDAEYAKDTACPCCGQSLAAA